MSLLGKLSYNQNWNIGFCDQNIESLIETRKLAPIQWMEHSYKDRWFADPFIYEINEEEIVTFVEEYRFDTCLGSICELHVDRKTKKLIRRYELLSLDTHLSYPAIIREDNKVFVYPENGQSGSLYIYEYDEMNHQLINKRMLINEPLADASIIKLETKYYLIATKYPETQEKAYLYFSNNLTGDYIEAFPEPMSSGMTARPGGNWIIHNRKLYRPVQDCSKRYGSGIILMNIIFNDKVYSESELLSLYPHSWKYNLGLHTLNVASNCIVVDGYGYTYPILGRLINLMLIVKSAF